MKNPLTYLNSLFDAFAERTLSGSDQLICLHIFNKFNRAHWPETVRMSDREIQELCRLYDSTGKPVTLKTIRNAKARLKLKGLIDFKAGNGDAPTEYCLTPLHPPFHSPEDTPLHPPFHSEPVPYIRAREDVKTLDLKTSINLSVDAQAGDTSELDSILEYWDELKGGRLTFEHQSALNALLKEKSTDWVKSAMKEAADANSNPRGLSPKFLFAVIKRKAQPLKGGDKNARQFDYDEEPDTSWIKPYR